MGRGYFQCDRYNVFVSFQIVQAERDKKELKTSRRLPVFTMEKRRGSPKRPREISVPSIDIQDQVEALQQALTTKDRVQAIHDIQCLCREAHESQEEIVSALIGAGILRTLTLQLNYVLRKHGTLIQEITELCELLSLFLQQATLFQISWEEQVDGLDLLELLAEVISRGERRNALSLLHFLSSSRSGTNFLLKSRLIVIELISLLHEHQNTEWLLDLLGIWKNVTCFYNEDSFPLFDFPDFVESLTSTPIENDIQIKQADRISSIFRNLATSSRNRNKMIQNLEVLKSLESLVILEYPTTRVNVLKCLSSLSMEQDTCVLLLFYGDGVFLTHMKKAFASPDARLRKEAARLARLWGSDPAAGIIMINDNRFMDALSKGALRDEDREVRQECVRAFTTCTDLVKSPMPQHEVILEALILLTRRIPDIPAPVVSKALFNQTKYKANRLLIAKKRILVDRLAGMALDTLTADDACGALAELSCEKEALPYLAVPSVMSAVSINLSSARDTTTLRAKYCMKTAINLSGVPTVRQNLARHRGFISSLIKSTAVASNEEKIEAKETIAMLVKEL